jgi:outer membrane receptor protein involved in Fe transport
LIGRFDSLDPSDGGDSSRYSVSGGWSKTGQNSATNANAYVVRSRLNLWNDFTFIQDDPVNGDQFKQTDQRVTTGINAKHTMFGKWGGREVENTVGMQARNDNISVGLFHTLQRQVLSTTRDDHVVESSAALYYQNNLRWTDWLRSIAGVRADYYRGDVTSDNPRNSGKASDHLFSPKLGLIFGPWAKTEYYLNYGRGFRSNDMRGATITVDPVTGNPATREPLLVRSTGYEAGLRTAIIPHLQSSFTVFRLDFQSELLFQGDAGTTADTGRSSRRVGFEFSNLYTPNSWLILDADVAFTRARYSDVDVMGVGDRVPGAIEGVATFTAAVDNLGPYYGSMRLRYFGPRPLIEDNTLRSNSTTLLSARAGYKFDRKARIQLDVFNLLNRQASQIDYAYTSQLRGEAAPVNDIHFHPTEPRSFRVSAILNF